MKGGITPDGGVFVFKIYTMFASPLFFINQIIFNYKDRKMESLTKFLLAVVVILGSTVLYALPVMLLWDWIMPDIFGLPQITFWQALGLSLLSSILFKDLGSKE